MDFVEVLAALKDASPWLVLACAGLGALYMVLQHRRKMRERSPVDEVRDIAVAIHDQCEESAEMLATHIASSAESEKVADQQTSLLSKIAHELMSMNASVAGRVVNMDNAKAIIAAQWNTCRNETIRLIVNSLRNNHFTGNEKLVTRKVYRAWRQASKSARSVIDILTGFEYPYRELFDKQIMTAWECIWGWALPIYYDSVSSREDAISDLEGRARMLFDDILTNYSTFIEDIDEGAIYAPHEESSSDIRQRSEPMIVVDGDLAEFSQAMIVSMEDWEPGKSSGGYDASQIRDAVERQYKEARTAQFGKSQDGE